MKIKKSLALLILLNFLFASSNSFAQIKFEREYRIKDELVPDPAKEFINTTFSDSRIKWYAEESQDGNSIEAKTKYNGHKYSVEFTPAGEILDVEKTVKFSSLPIKDQEGIANSLDKTFSKFKIVKVQIQWVDDKGVLAKLIKDNTRDPKHDYSYEIVLKGRKAKQKKFYEVLLNNEFSLLTLLEIVKRETDNLEF